MMEDVTSLVPIVLCENGRCLKMYNYCIFRSLIIAEIYDFKNKICKHSLKVK